MKNEIIAAIDRISGDRLTHAMREEIAAEAIRIMEAATRAAALSAIEIVKDHITTVEKVADNDKNGKH